MKINNWDIIAKDLAGETSLEEKQIILNLRDTNSQFDAAYSDSEKIWKGLQMPRSDFDKNRMKFIIDAKIKSAEKNRFNKIVSSSIKYAAIFIGLLMLSVFVYNDITHQEIYTADNYDIITLPDGSRITLNNDAEISFNKSLILGFTREVNIIKGSAYFEITKKKGENFIVNTDNYDIEVLGTKFIVDNNKEETSVVLDEGRIKIFDYCVQGIDNIEMVPGEKVVFGRNMDQPTHNKENPAISKYWMQSRLEFDNYSLDDLKVIFREYYNKELILYNTNVELSRIGGSAPVDDVDLIVKALSKIFKKELIIKQDSIIIK